MGVSPVSVISALRAFVGSTLVITCITLVEMSWRSPPICSLFHFPGPICPSDSLEGVPI